MGLRPEGIRARQRQSFRRRENGRRKVGLLKGSV